MNILWQELKAVQYLRTILGHAKFQAAAADSSRSRLPLVRLIKTFVDVSPGVVRQSASLQDLLAVYRGTTSESDTILLSIFRSSELSGDSFRELAMRWSPVPGSALRQGFQAIALLDASAMQNACVRALNEPSLDSEGVKVYDPLFILSYLACIVDSDTITGYEWADLAKSRALGLAVCALSSDNPLIRTSADRLLAKIRNRLQVNVQHVS
jgi:hypothetical protein